MRQIIAWIWFPFGLLMGVLAIPGLCIGLVSRWLIQHSPLATEFAIMEWVWRKRFPPGD